MLPRKTKHIAIIVSGLVLSGCIVLFIWLATIIVGIETQTANPSETQISHAREFLYINPELDIEPIAYYIKEGMDYQVMLKFVTKTDDPIQIFDNRHVDPSNFKTNYVFKRGEVSLNKNWWDMASHKLAGGDFWVPKGAEKSWKLSIGFFENGNGALTVYTWRHETGISERK